MFPGSPSVPVLALARLFPLMLAAFTSTLALIASMLLPLHLEVWVPRPSKRVSVPFIPYMSALVLCKVEGEAERWWHTSTCGAIKGEIVDIGEISGVLR